MRTYAVREATPAPSDPHAALDALFDVAVATYAPLPSATIGWLASGLVAGAPQWRADRAGALRRARARLATARVDGVDWYWPAHERIRRTEPAERVRLLAPFDPVVWDRRRFERFWGWAYRFEAYTPAHKRVRGYYALPLLWRDAVIGWANLSVQGGRLTHEVGFVSGRAPRERAFGRELERELEAMRRFLGV